MPSFALRIVCAFGLALTASLVADPITLPLIKDPDPCSPYEFTCKSGQCVSQYNVCDTFEDCHDGDDENVTMCLARPCHPDYPYRCTHNGICIPLSWLCDGHNDCGDNSDEVTLSCVKILHKERTIHVDKDDPNATEPNVDNEDDIKVINNDDNEIINDDDDDDEDNNKDDDEENKNDEAAINEEFEDNE